MTLQIQRSVNPPAILTDEQRQRVGDALEDSQSANSRRNYTGQFRKFGAWCERENYFPLPAFPEMVVKDAMMMDHRGGAPTECAAIRPTRWTTAWLSR